MDTPSNEKLSPPDERRIDFPVANTRTVSHTIVLLLVMGIILSLATLVIAAVFHANGQVAPAASSVPINFP